MSRLTTKQRCSRRRRRASYADEWRARQARREAIAEAAIEVMWKTMPVVAAMAGPYLDPRLLALFLD